MRLTGAAAALLLAAAAAASPVPPVDLEREARAIEAMLVAPCCWTQQVSLHQSPAAAQIKSEIRDALRAGRTREQIVDAYVAEYGPRILIEPPARGFGAWLYLLPVVALVLSAAAVGWLVRTFARRGAAPGPLGNTEAEAVPDRELSARLDDELQDLD